MKYGVPTRRYYLHHNKNLSQRYILLVDINKPGINCGATIISPTTVITAAHCISAQWQDLVVSTGHLAFDPELAKNESGYQSAKLKIA